MVGEVGHRSARFPGRMRRHVRSWRKPTPHSKAQSVNRLNLACRIALLDQRTALADQCLHSAEADVRPQGGGPGLTDTVEKIPCDAHANFYRLPMRLKPLDAGDHVNLRKIAQRFS